MREKEKTSIMAFSMISIPMRYVGMVRGINAGAITSGERSASPFQRPVAAAVTNVEQDGFLSGATTLREQFSKAGLEATGFQTATATTNGANGVLFAAKRPFAFRCATPPG
jgi:hypothetical protein